MLNMIYNNAMGPANAKCLILPVKWPRLFEIYLVSDSSSKIQYFQLQNHEYVHSGVSIVLCVGFPATN